MYSVHVRAFILQARDVLAIGLRYVNKARQIVALPDQKSIADVSWVQELNSDMFAPLSVEELEALSAKPPPTPGQGKTGAESVWNTVRDLHLELIFMFHRVCLKLVALGPGWSTLYTPYQL